jgi:hypothetical protein
MQAHTQHPPCGRGGEGREAGSTASRRPQSKAVRPPSCATPSRAWGYMLIHWLYHLVRVEKARPRGAPTVGQEDCVSIAHGFHNCNGYPLHGWPETIRDRGGSVCRVSTATPRRQSVCFPLYFAGAQRFALCAAPYPHRHRANQHSLVSPPFIHHPMSNSHKNVRNHYPPLPCRSPKCVGGPCDATNNGPSPSSPYSSSSSCPSPACGPARTGPAAGVFQSQPDFAGGPKFFSELQNRFERYSKYTKGTPSAPATHFLSTKQTDCWAS